MSAKWLTRLKYIAITLLIVGLGIRYYSISIPTDNMDELRKENIVVICDRVKGVEYLYKNNYRETSLTVRYDTDGMVSRCELQDNNQGDSK